ncbi:heme NO-binding domain-containing protein [Oceanospirillum sediminis]|uniref:Heme NO-binding domain-containing protein n=1 Tax=Oceanospirillum sediminis TaxID=2760088 RepID=A0A839IW66_9GAMM|nr:heme NO-binding domain-containing protein [Oceanospirillum sediminis]MBB1489198.1 heme NO-binding domain-containing protein [Oceanospirillum sediminis]
MLGIVFTEFAEMVETAFSEDVLDDVLDAPGLSTEGAFTSVGYYNHKDMIIMVTALSEVTGVPVDDLVTAFGKHLFSKLIAKYPTLVAPHSDLLSFLEVVDGVVHEEVMKLYPRAELPVFQTERKSEHNLLMRYQSKRPFSRLALGLIHGAAEHFDTNIDVSFQSEDSDILYSTLFDIRIKHDG